MAEKETPVPAAKQSERNAQTFSSRLLCTLQQLCDGISVAVF